MFGKRKSLAIEEAINKELKGETRETALAFAAYLKANGLTPLQWHSGMDYKIPSGEGHPCMIQFDPNQWRLTFFAGDYSGEHDAGFTRAVQDHVQFCKACHDGCSGPREMKIFGKEFANVCSQLTVQFENPDAATLEHIKGLIEYWKTAGPSDSWHYNN
jgi:hypothetical protein